MQSSFHQDYDTAIHLQDYKWLGLNHQVWEIIVMIWKILNNEKLTHYKLCMSDYNPLPQHSLYPATGYMPTMIHLHALFLWCFHHGGLFYDKHLAGYATAVTV